VTDAPVVKPRRIWKYFLVLAGAGLLLLLAGLWYITTDSFQGYVRRRVVAEVERITGGRAEIGSFHVVPFHMQVEVRDITVHGGEGSGEIPLAHADHLIAQLKVVSLLRTEFSFHALSLDHPVIHIVIAPDGTTNVPALKVQLPAPNRTLDQLFALSIDHLSVHDGELVWGNQRIPLDFDVRNTGLQMDYSFLRRRYESRLTLGKVDTIWADFRPFAWMLSVHFSLGPTFADIESLQWTSGRSHVNANGRMSDFQNPRFDGNYEGHVDLEEVAAILRRQDLRQGGADFHGNGHWSTSEFDTAGAVAVRDLGWNDDLLHLKKADVSSDYNVTDQQLRLSKIQGKLLGGLIGGDAQVDNWLHSIPIPSSNSNKGETNTVAEIRAARPVVRNAAKQKLPGVQVGTVRLRLRDISLAEVAASHPLGRVRPAGTANGTLDAAWRGSPQDAEIAFTVDVTPPSISATSQLPVTAHTEGKYRLSPDELELAQFNLSTPASRVQASGKLSTSSTLRLSVSTSNLEEWRPLVAALGGPTDLPFRVDGDATFNGTVGGSFSAPTLAGALVAQDFEFMLPPTSRTPAQAVHWDSLAASIQFSSREVTMRAGSLRRGETSAEFDVAASLQKGKFTEDSPYTARVNLHHVDVASTAALAAFDYPVSGTADVSLQIAGTRAAPQVQGHISAVNASAYGESIEKFDSDLLIREGETALEKIHLTHQDASVDGTAAYNPDSRTFRIDLAGKNFDLARVRQIQVDHLPVNGRADFNLRISGTVDSPVVNAGVQVRDLAFDRELSGAYQLTAETSNGQLRITGRSDFVRGDLSIQGTVGMHGDFPAAITAQMKQLDLDPLWRAYLGGQLTGHSSVGGSVAMQGPLRYPAQWVLRGDAANLMLEAEYVKLHNEGPVRFQYAAQTAHIDPLHLIGEGTDITGGGSIGFSGARDLDLTANGQMDLKLLGSLNSNFTASGLMSTQMVVRGTVAEPQPQGRIQIKGGSINYAGLPSGLSEMNGSLAFTLDRIRIEQLTARTGGGTLDLKGEATTYNQQINFNLTAVGRDVRLRYPPGVSSTANAELHWVGNRSASTVSGDILVTKLAVTPGFDFGSYLERSRQTVALAPANSPLYNVKLDVAVRTAPELQMKTAVARLSGDADLRLRGSVARPSVLGRADILEGDATFNGIKFRLERGDITFTNPVAIEPQVNMQATTHVRNYDLDVTVTGTPDRLNVNYRSEPPLPKSDIIALLALGRTNEESEQLQQQSGQTPFTDEATALIINQAINQTVTNRMQKLFGVSRIKIDPGLTTETNANARGPQVTIEQQFANNLSLTYSTNVAQSSQQIIQGEYYFTRNISAVGTRDQNGVVSFDVRIRRRKK
jgi:translocation and assembly module TamB